MAVELKPHQEEAIDILVKNKYFILADKQGLGKTATAILASDRQVEDYGYTLIVTPAFLIYNWEAEYFKFTGKDTSLIKAITSKKAFNDFCPRKHHAALISYANIAKYPALFKHASAVLFEEGHYLSNMDAKRTQYAHYYINNYNPEYMFILTGTPIKNRVKELYSLLRLVDYGGYTDGQMLTRFKTDRSFAEYFSIPTTYEFYRNRRRISQTVYSGFRNLDELKEIVGSRRIRRTEVKDLSIPTIQFKGVQVFKTKSDNSYIKYEQFKEQKDKSITTAKVDSAIRKAPFTAEYCENLLLSEEIPLIVFSDHKEPLRKISEKLNKKKFITATIDGTVAMKKRNDIVNQFQAGEIDVLLGTLGAMSTGLTLTKSNNVVLNDQSWIPSTNEQAIKRANRIGSTKTCFVHIMIGDHLDKKLQETLEEKMETIKKVID